MRSTQPPSISVSSLVPAWEASSSVSHPSLKLEPSWHTWQTASPTSSPSSHSCSSASHSKKNAQQETSLSFARKSPKDYISSGKNLCCVSWLYYQRSSISC